MQGWIAGILAGLFVLILEAPSHQRGPYEIYGIDVSHYQSRVQWDEVARQGAGFAFVKATEGGSHQDSLFALNWFGIRAAGLKRGAYHFYRPNTPSFFQATNFMNVVDMQPGDLPPVLDVEVTDGASKEELVSGVKEWLELIETRYQVRPILYTNLKFYYFYLKGHFDDYPIWIARYNIFQPRLASGKDWHFWQFADQGRMKGIHGPVDFNVFRGTMEELEAICLQAPPPCDPEEEAAKP